MPSETLNRTEDLMQKLGNIDDTQDESDLQLVLEEAHRDTVSSVGRNFVEDKRIRKQVETGEIIETFNLEFAHVFEVDEILKNEREVIDSSNYTVDKENGTVTFDSSFVEDELYFGQVIRFKYKPVKFKDIELWRAVSIAKNQEIIQLEDSEQDALHSNALTRAKRLENQVNKRAGPGNARDGDIRRGTK